MLDACPPKVTVAANGMSAVVMGKVVRTPETTTWTRFLPRLAMPTTLIPFVPPGRQSMNTNRVPAAFLIQPGPG
jgi:hypothetical protein